MSDVTFGTDDVCDIAGITYRQCDYWSRQGLLQPHVFRGPGHARRHRSFPVIEVRCAIAIATVTRHYGNGSPLRSLVADALRAHPASKFVVVIDHAQVVGCESAEEVVDAQRGACFCTVIRIDTPEGHGVNLSAESTASSRAFPASPPVSSRQPPVASAALST